LNERQKQVSEEGKCFSGICHFLFLKSALAYNRQIGRFFSPASEIHFNHCETAVATGEGLNHGPTPVSSLRLSELLSQSQVNRHTRSCPIDPKGFLQRLQKDRSYYIGSKQCAMKSRLLFPKVDNTRRFRG